MQVLLVIGGAVRVARGGSVAVTHRTLRGEQEAQLAVTRDLRGGDPWRTGTTVHIGDDLDVGGPLLTSLVP
jgi:hypothetical protein